MNFIFANIHFMRVKMGFISLFFRPETEPLEIHIIGRRENGASLHVTLDLTGFCIHMYYIVYTLFIHCLYIVYKYLFFWGVVVYQ